jgi:hypothetical protein
MVDDCKVELKISYDKGNLEKLCKAKNLFEQDFNNKVNVDVFIGVFVEAFIFYRNLRGATESQLLQRIASKQNEPTV